MSDGKSWFFTPDDESAGPILTPFSMFNLAVRKLRGEESVVKVTDPIPSVKNGHFFKHNNNNATIIDSCEEEEEEEEEEVKYICNDNVPVHCPIKPMVIEKPECMSLYLDKDKVLVLVLDQGKYQICSVCKGYEPYTGLKTLNCHKPVTVCLEKEEKEKEKEKECPIVRPVSPCASSSSSSCFTKSEEEEEEDCHEEEEEEDCKEYVKDEDDCEKIPKQVQCTTTNNNNNNNTPKKCTKSDPHDYCECNCGCSSRLKTTYRTWCKTRLGNTKTLDPIELEKLAKLLRSRIFCSWCKKYCSKNGIKHPVLQMGSSK